jgi:hypothetical protein
VCVFLHRPFERLHSQERSPPGFLSDSAVLLRNVTANLTALTDANLPTDRGRSSCSAWLRIRRSTTAPLSSRAANHFGTLSIASTTLNEAASTLASWTGPALVLRSSSRVRTCECNH